MTTETSISIADPGHTISITGKLGLSIFGAGILVLLLAAFGAGNTQPLLFLLAGFGLVIAGSLIYIVSSFTSRPESTKNNGIFHSSLTAGGLWGWVLGIVLTGMYVIIYWFPGYLEHLIRITDPLSFRIRGKAGDQWFLYGISYTTAVLVMGTRALIKYRSSQYQVIRTASVMFFQLVFSFLIPALLQLLNEPEFYFSYFWPLKYDYLFPSTLQGLLNNPSRLAVFMAFWTATISIVGVPVLTYFFGKRWYCSWVCGCGGLANTAGDPFRQLSDKSLKAWKIERWMVHSVLVFITLTTLSLWVNSYSGGRLFGSASSAMTRTYGFLIGAVFSGVIGVGFYPILGTRVWCRFGCPMAAYLGILQKYFSRFRITTNGGQCISCGNCSTYCEMGIDVRAYAQKGQNIVRASCVGCGMCANVCPRGVLNLENGPDHKNRVDERPILIGNDSVSLHGIE